MRQIVITLVAALAVAGCVHNKIPGTEIEDTSDTRAILDVMEHYRRAVEQKDVSGITGLVDSSFKDDGGSPNPDDDLDYGSLSQKLTERFAKLDNVKLDLDVRKIKIQDNQAAAVYHYNTSFVVLSPLNKVRKADSDIKEMEFKRVGGAWKITSGI